METSHIDLTLKKGQFTVDTRETLKLEYLQKIIYFLSVICVIILICDIGLLHA